MLAAAAEACGGLAWVVWLIAVVIAVYGVLSLVRGAVVMGLVLIVLAFLIGPGGYSIIC